MDLVHRDIVQIGLARECMFLARRKMKLIEAFADETTPSTSIQNEVAMVTKRWGDSFLNLIRTTVQKEMATGEANYDRVLKTFRYSLLCEHISKMSLHVSRSKHVLENFTLQSDVGILDTILTGGL